MQQLFLTVLNISVRASVLICCVLLIRKIASGRCNRAISLLWTLVAIRLLLPFSIAVPGLPTYDSRMTVWASSAEQSNPGIVTEIQKKPVQQTTVQPTESEGQDDSAGMAGTGNTAVNPTKGGNFHNFLMMTLSVIWIAGITLFAGYNLYTLIRLRRTLTESIPTECVMRCDGIAVPFVFGLIHPRIYVPSDLPEEDIKTVIAHEKVHVRRGDHIAKVLFTFVTVVHWFNPLVWAAFWLFDRDLEMSCDDSVTEKMTEEERTDYLNTVLSCSRKRVASSGFLPGFADGSLRERITNIKRTKKNRRLAVLLSLLTGIVLFGCSFATGKKPAEEQGEIKTNQAEIDADAEKKQREADEKRLEELKLDPLASYYMNTSPEKGLTVCVWKMIYGYENGEGQILCGLLPRQLDKIYEPKGTYDPGNYYDPEYTYDMGRMGLGLGGVPPEDMKIILSTFDLPKEKISVIAWHNIADASGFTKEPGYFEVQEVKDYLLGDRQ